MVENELIWYASYGSNINENRFLCYITGGTPEGTDKRYEGCSNKALPKGKYKIIINYTLYFAKSSSTWDNGAVGFLQNEFKKDTKTLGRMYLITKEQFIEILQQETGRKKIDIDFKKAEVESYVFAPASWYGKILFLGKEDGYPIFTFTNENNLEANKPAKSYLKTIAIGLNDCYGLSSDEIATYFSDKAGIINKYSFEELKSF